MRDFHSLSAARRKISRFIANMNDLATPACLFTPCLARKIARRCEKTRKGRQNGENRTRPRFLLWKNGGIWKFDLIQQTKLQNVILISTT